MPSAKMNCFVDTNLLVYAIDPREQGKRLRAADLLRKLVSSRTLVLSPQSLNEFYRVATERHRLMSVRDAREFVGTFIPSCTAPYDLAVTFHAWMLQDETSYGWWDCMLLASASLSGADIFLSEDLQDGQKIGAMTILDPFKTTLEFLE